MAKKKMATVWLGGCSGCHMSLLDIDERILEVAKLADILKSPVVDGKEFPECDLALVEGCICNDEHVHEIQVIRKRAKVLVAFGDCGREIALAVKRHAERELRVELRRVLREHVFQFHNRDGEITPAEIEHRVVVLFLQSHCGYATHVRLAAQAAWHTNSSLPLAGRLHQACL